MTLENININAENNMKTIIPNKVALGLDFNDLPARANDVDDDSIKLLGGRRNITFRCFNRRRPTVTCGRVTLGPGSNGGGGRLVCRRRFSRCCGGWNLCTASRI